MSNSTSLENNETVEVSVSNDYSQGLNYVELNATIDNFVDEVKELFEIRQLQIIDFQAINVSDNVVYFNLSIQNNLATQQIFSWKIDSGISNISESGVVEAGNMTSITQGVTYSASGVYHTEAFINSTSYNDTIQGVVIT
jgi:hypothetical protein